MRFRLRVVEGPLEGATYHLRDSFVLGRSGACDLAILDPSVSRLHARVSTNGAGGHVLADLGSANGTRVNREPIQERTLAPGDEIAICGVRFVYEPLPAVAQEAANTAGTVRARGRASAPERDLLGDVIAYRSLAATVIRGEALTVTSLARLRELDTRLRDADGTQGFLELPFEARARVRPESAEDGEAIDVRLCTLGVGGATLHTPRGGLTPQSVVHLILDRPELGAGTTVALTGVVVEVGPILCSVAFSMCTGWAERLSPIQRAETIRIDTTEPAWGELEVPVRAHEEHTQAEPRLRLVP